MEFMKSKPILSLEEELMNHPVYSFNFESEIEPKLRDAKLVLFLQRQFPTVITDGFTIYDLIRKNKTEIQNIRLAMEDQLDKEGLL